MHPLLRARAGHAGCCERVPRSRPAAGCGRGHRIRTQLGHLDGYWTCSRPSYGLSRRCMCTRTGRSGRMRCSAPSSIRQSRRTGPGKRSNPVQQAAQIARCKSGQPAIQHCTPSFLLPMPPKLPARRETTAQRGSATSAAHSELRVAAFVIECLDRSRDRASVKFASFAIRY